MMMKSRTGKDTFIDKGARQTKGRQTAPKTNAQRWEDTQRVRVSAKPAGRSSIDGWSCPALPHLHRMSATTADVDKDDPETVCPRTNCLSIPSRALQTKLSRSAEELGPLMNSPMLSESSAGPK